jgi:hypothetical protein
MVCCAGLFLHLTERLLLLSHQLLPHVQSVRVGWILAGESCGYYAAALGVASSRRVSVSSARKGPVLRALEEKHAPSRLDLRPTRCLHWGHHGGRFVRTLRAFDHMARCRLFPKQHQPSLASKSRCALMTRRWKLRCVSRGDESEQSLILTQHLFEHSTSHTQHIAHNGLWHASRSMAAATASTAMLLLTSTYSCT